MDDLVGESVLVQVVEVGAGREIGWGSNVADKLEDHLADIRRAIKAGAHAVSQGLPDLQGTRDWEVGEVSAKFGITLTAEAGVLLSRAGAEATFEVNVTFQRLRSAPPYHPPSAGASVT